MEGIYIIHTRESIKCKEKIYKIGCSYNLYKRIKQYPKNSKVLFLFVCDNCRDVESCIKKYFNINFKQVTEYGSEYFEGDVEQMKNYIRINMDGIEVKYKQTNDFIKKYEPDIIFLAQFSLIIKSDLIKNYTKKIEYL